MRVLKYQDCMTLQSSSWVTECDLFCMKLSQIAVPLYHPQKSWWHCRYISIKLSVICFKMTQKESSKEYFIKICANGTVFLFCTYEL